MEQIIIKQMADWTSLGELILTRLKPLVTNHQQATCLVLSGDLGAGKTTFTQILAKMLGVKEVIPSPTFTIMKFYQTADSSFKKIVHMDAYRIEDKSELYPLGFFELLNAPETLICIEWGEKIIDFLPKGTTLVSINHQPSDLRLVTVKTKD